MDFCFAASKSFCVKEEQAFTDIKLKGEDSVNNEEQEVKKARKGIDVKHVARGITKAAASAADNVGKAAVTVAGKTKDVVVKSQEAVCETLDQNGDGKVDTEDVIIMGLKVPGIRIDCEQFLRKEFQTKCTQEGIDRVVESTPLRAGIARQLVDEIADAS